VQAGADVNAVDKVGACASTCTVRMMLCDRGFCGATLTLCHWHCGCAQDGWTPLHRAVSRDNGHIMETLVRLGADVNAVDKVPKQLGACASMCIRAMLCDRGFCAATLTLTDPVIAGWKYASTPGCHRWSCWNRGGAGAAGRCHLQSQEQGTHTRICMSRKCNASTLRTRIHSPPTSPSIVLSRTGRHDATAARPDKGDAACS
jgi:hypothetical protein